jgi:hypothetical protein
MIHILCDEFVIHCSHDWDVFEEHYPGLRNQYTMLLKAVHIARIACGDGKAQKAHIP